MLLTVQHLQIAVSDAKKDIARVDSEFKTSTTAIEYKRTHEELKNNIDKMKQQIMQLKLKKFERDTRDYQFDRVYSWSEERAEYRRKNLRRRTNVNYTDMSSTDSEATTSDSSRFRKMGNQNVLEKVGNTNQGGQQFMGAAALRKKK